MEYKRNGGNTVVGGAPEGARSATGGATSTTVGALPEGQRWSVRRKLAVVTRLLCGESLELVSREVRVPIYQLAEWRDEAIFGMESALKSRKDDPTERKLAEAQRRIGEITMENELLRERCRRGGGPFCAAEIAEMSAMRSPAIDVAYGVNRVCSAWEHSRSAYYAKVVRATTPAVPSGPKQKRGPKTALSDDDLLGVIRQTIEDSYFDGEGYRKIWAYLK